MRFLPHGPLLRVLRSFAPSSFPALLRSNYRWELTSACFMPLALACVEGGVVGVIARKGFGAGSLAVSAITAAPAVANLSSLMWGRVLHGTDRVRAVNLMQIGVLLCVLAIALAPRSGELGVAVIVAAMLVARTLLTGVINARADLWLANYPRQDRARTTGNLTIVATLVICASSLLVGWVMDSGVGNGQGFRYVYGASAVMGLAGVAAFSRVRWRGRAATLARERAGLDGGKASVGARAMLSVLKNDKTYRRFMWAQFVLGVPAMASDAPFIVALDEQFSLDYNHAIALTQVVPIFVAILVIPLWARLLDRVHIIHFRAWHSWVFVLSLFMMGLGFLLDSLWVVWAARIVLGIANGGGMLAWNLGHHDFAKGSMAAVYMGVHVTLTGVRGAFAPFVGALVYSPVSLQVGATTLSWPGIGAWTFVVLGVVCAGGALMFVRMHLKIRAQGRTLTRS